MDEFGQGVPSYPVAGSVGGPPGGGAGAPPSVPYAYPPYAPSPDYPPPQAKKGRGWLVALVVVGVFVIGVVVMCGWVATLMPSGTKPVIASDAIALIRIEGVIAGTSGSIGGESVTPEVILDQLQQAEDDNRVKAILLRVDSPGGTVAASEEIAAEVARAKKPVVVSIGDVGASGAYMVSSQSDWIVSAAGSSVGSIGVILEVANLQGLLDKLGVKFAVITAGEYKDLGSPYRSLTATETQMLQEQVDLVYNQFIDIVAKGRKMPKDEVLELATGMAWVGTQAKSYGLVDQIGTYNDAVDKAMSLGGIRGSADIVEYGRTPYLDFIDALLGISAKLGQISKVLGSTPTGEGAPTRPLAR